MSLSTSSITSDENASHLDGPKRRGIAACLLQNWFMISTIFGVAIGLGAGFGIQQVGLDETGKTWIDMPGNIYIRLLKLTILPMIASNIINVMGKLKPKEDGKVSVVALGFILFFNLLSACIGVVYAIVIKPGKSITPPNSTSSDPMADPGNQISYIFRDLFLNIFPENIVAVTMFQAATNFSDGSLNANKETVYPPITADGTNMIGLLFVSLAFGIASNSARENGGPFKKFFESFGEVIMILMQKFLLVTPVGVLFMVMSSIATVNNIADTFVSLGLFVLFNFVGLLTHFIFLMLSLVVLGRNPFRILRYSFPMYFISFATTSPIVSLPKAFIAADKYGVPTKISRFVLPFAATMKADASAVFIAGSCLFVAQLQNVDLDIAKIVIILILSFAYVTALPNIPSSSVIAVVTILGSVGVDPKGASLLYAVEWINDRLRSGNVGLSNLICTVFTYHVVERGRENEDVNNEDGDEEEEDGKHYVSAIDIQSDSLEKA